MATDSDQQPVDAAAAPAHGPEDGTGLTGRGAIVLVTVVGLAAALVDAMLTQGLGLIFAVLFVLASLLGAAAVRRHEVAATVIAPPLIYVLACVVAGQVGQSPGGLKQLALETALAFATNAPVVYLATGLAGAVVLARVLRSRSRG